MLESRVLSYGLEGDLDGSHNIYLLSPFGKLFEYFLQARIIGTVRGRRILRDCQLGFRSGLSSNFVGKDFESKYGTIPRYYLDFDSVWHFLEFHIKYNRLALTVNPGT